MKIISNKKWKEFNDKFIDIQIENKDLKDDNTNYIEQVKVIVDINNNLKQEKEILERELLKAREEIDKLKQQRRKLKYLCTQNNLNYKEDINVPKRKYTRRKPKNS